MAVRESYSIKSDRARGSAPGIVKLFVFLTFWGLIGFALGTVTLLGPVRWWAGLCRDRGFSEGFESGGVVALILILAAVSMSLALWAATTWVRSPSFLVRLMLPIVVFGVAYFAYSFWMNPSSLESSMAAENVASPNFTFGPYPTDNRLRELRSEGYTAVVSLLHPAVVPFEPKLIEQERKAAEAAGIELIHLPMLPWVSDNKESLDQLRALAETKKGRYYIHCYLGEDRVNVARRVVELATGGEVEISGLDTRKRIGNKSRFERGEVIHLGDNIHLTPFPTDGELNSYFLGGGVGSVIALMDERVPTDAEWIRKERRLLSAMQVDYKVMGVSFEHYDPEVIMNAVALARSARKPVVVHAFLPVSSGKSPAAEAFLQAFETGKPPIPPSMLLALIGGGEASVVAPNVAVGQAPFESDWSNTLQRAGVRTAIFAGPEASALPDDSAHASAAGIEWIALDDENSIISRVGSGGPYYLYGPLTQSLRDRVARKYGPALPRKATS